MALLDKYLGKIIDWVETAEKRLSALENSIENLNNTFKKPKKEKNEEVTNEINNIAAKVENLSESFNKIEAFLKNFEGKINKANLFELEKKVNQNLTQMDKKISQLIENINNRDSFSSQEKENKTEKPTKQTEKN